MRRRAFLSGTAAVGSVMAGCLSSEETDGVSGTPAASPSALTFATPVPQSELEDVLPRDAIPAIVDPAFAADWGNVEMTVDPPWGDDHVSRPRLSPNDRVIGLTHGGRARAYPLRVLDWHEVVNDAFGGPLLVTFCPLCESGLTAARVVEGEPTIFGVSGILWRANLVMYDRATDSLWSQLHATAIRGPNRGEQLSLVPSTFTTWGTWRDRYPDTKVLLPPPYSVSTAGPSPGINIDDAVSEPEIPDRYANEVPRDYGVDPYEGYRNSQRVGLGNTRVEDDRLHPKELVIGVRSGGEARAYPRSVVLERRVINDKLGELQIVVAAAPDDVLVAYARRARGRVLRFASAGEGVMRAAGSRWSVAAGRALDGPYRGIQLRRANQLTPLFWFAWVASNPSTDVYRP